MHEHDFRRLAENLPDNIVRYDREGRAVYVNPVLEKTLGLGAAKMMGTRIRELYPDGSYETYAQSVDAALASGQNGEIEFVVPIPSKLPITHQIRFIVERDEHGAVSGVLAIGRDITALKQAESERLANAEKLERLLIQTIDAISATVEARDPYTAGHEHRVGLLASTIAREMGLSDEVVHGIFLAASIHDLGKIRVPAEILSKPGRLSPIEYELIKCHSQTGYDIVKDIQFPQPIARMVLQHHERMDGSGYPQGLKGEQILLEARILAVADVVEAMASHRPYRAGLGLEAALAEIIRQRGTQLDQVVVDSCVALFREKKFAFETS